MIIEIKKGRKIGNQQLYEIIVDGEVRYENLTYEELCKVTIGELDRVEEG